VLADTRRTLEHNTSHDVTCQLTGRHGYSDTPQHQLEEAIAALTAYIKEQARLAALAAADDNHSDGCGGRLAGLGACPGEDAAIADGLYAACSGSAGWGCLVTGLTAFIPFGEIADALGITEAALALGSKALDAIAPGLSDAVAAGVQGAQKLLGALGDAASKISTKILGDNAAVGLAGDDAKAAFVNMNRGGGHAIRHLSDDGVIPNTGNLASRVNAARDALVPILTNPTKTFTWKVGGTMTQAFAGEVDGTQVVAFVATDGKWSGKLISAVVPDADQIAQWGL